MSRSLYSHTHTHTLLPLYACLAISWGCENGCAPVADEEHVALEEDDEVPAPPPAVALMEASGTAARGDRTLTLHRTLRSGSSVRYDGDVIIFGDVNPGAQVFASGNILVMGALKGMAHAGASGSEDVFILGFTLQPTQLRIGRKIAIVPGRRPDRSGFLPDIARIEDGQIVIEPYKSGSSR